MQWFFILIVMCLLSSCGGGHHRESRDGHSFHHHGKKILTSKQLYLQQAPSSYWTWPTHGHILSGFSSANRGINFAGYLGDPIYAAAPGKVLYSGAMRGYGNLIIIKHSHSILTTYAYANKVLVKAGEKVRSGQKIAEIGETDMHRTILHFEIRENGYPVNPLMYLSNARARN